MVPVSPYWQVPSSWWVGEQLVVAKQVKSLHKQAVPPGSGEHVSAPRAWVCLNLL